MFAKLQCVEKCLDNVIDWLQMKNIDLKESIDNEKELQLNFGNNYHCEKCANDKAVISGIYNTVYNTMYNNMYNIIAMAIILLLAIAIAMIHSGVMDSPKK